MYAFRNFQLFTYEQKNVIYVLLLGEFYFGFCEIFSINIYVLKQFLEEAIAIAFP